MSHRERPKKVLAAILRDDREALSIMGMLGGIASQKARRIKKARFQREMLEQMIETNEHIIGFDGQSGPCPDGVVPF